MTKTLFSIKATKLIREIANPLKAAGLTHFMHDITFGNGQISMLMTDPEVYMLYYKARIPAICTNENGRVLQTGIYLGRTLRENYQDAKLLYSKLIYGQNSIHIMVREPDRQHLYSLFFDLNESDFLHWLINNSEYLKDFIGNYNYTASDIIAEVQDSKNRVTLPLFTDLNPVEVIRPPAVQLRLFHRQTKSPIFLSVQQSRCFLLLMEGKSAKQIGVELKLSYRTVEHYFAAIRKILGCASNKELISFYAEQIFTLNEDKKY